MTIRIALLTLAALAGSAALASPGAWAANADQPNTNVDRRNDAGNDTGNSRVDQLNAGQLNSNQGGPNQGGPNQGRAAPGGGPAAPAAAPSR